MQQPRIDLPTQPSLPGYVGVSGRGQSSAAAVAAAVLVQRSEAVMHFLYGEPESGFHAAVVNVQQSGTRAGTAAPCATSKGPASRGPMEAIVEVFRKFCVVVCGASVVFL
jgi:hypothetical protein